MAVQIMGKKEKKREKKKERKEKERKNEESKLKICKGRLGFKEGYPS